MDIDNGAPILDFTQECPSFQPGETERWSWGRPPGDRPPWGQTSAGTNVHRACVLPGATPLASDPAASGTGAFDPRRVSVPLLPASLPGAGMTQKEDPWFPFPSTLFRPQHSEPLTQLLRDRATHLEVPGFACGSTLPIHMVSSN